MTYSHLRYHRCFPQQINKYRKNRKISLACLDMDRVGHIKNGNRSRSQSSREVRNKNQSNTIEMAALVLGSNLQSEGFFWLLSIL